MLIEICIFVSVFGLLMLKMDNKSEWWYNIRHSRGNNWCKKWRKIPTTKLALVLFAMLLVLAVSSSFFSFELNYMVWDFYFIIHMTLFLLAGATLYLFLWCLGGRAKRIGKAVGTLSKVEGIEPTGKKTAKGETFVDGMFKSLFDVLFGESGKRKKKKGE